MQSFILVIHLLLVVTLVVIVLIQPSEGGGIGAGSTFSFMAVRSTKNALTRLTAILALCFFLTSILLTVVETISNKRKLDRLNHIPVSNITTTINQTV
ncbi:MAG: preprotein translocase subunit SecG [Candidatus Tokpelaia sp. JSC161]|nr:MAG: preprotein translocase subunit SecG [Candidatus Tokpelaia sp. JSC161]